MAKPLLQQKDSLPADILARSMMRHAPEARGVVAVGLAGY
jgi:hypothetical protein